jgi:Spx/MgsR family transcriptional regulator
MASNLITIYGIPNCSSVKKAREWMTTHQVAHDFHDFKKQGLSPEHLSLWLTQVDWTVLLNRKGTTWRKLDAPVQAGVTDKQSAKLVMLAHASTIKRPVIVWPSGQVTVGFDPEKWPTPSQRA